MSATYPFAASTSYSRCIPGMNLFPPLQSELNKPVSFPPDHPIWQSTTSNNILAPIQNWTPPNYAYDSSSAPPSSSASTAPSSPPVPQTSAAIPKVILQEPADENGSDYWKKKMDVAKRVFTEAERRWKAAVLKESTALTNSPKILTLPISSKLAPVHDSKENVPAPPKSAKPIRGTDTEISAINLKAQEAERERFKIRLAKRRALRKEEAEKEAAAKAKSRQLPNTLTMAPSIGKVEASIPYKRPKPAASRTDLAASLPIEFRKISSLITSYGPATFRALYTRPGYPYHDKTFIRDLVMKLIEMPWLEKVRNVTVSQVLYPEDEAPTARLVHHLIDIDFRHASTFAEWTKAEKATVTQRVAHFNKRRGALRTLCH